VEEYLNEKEQWERVLAWLREQGPWILAGVAVALAIYGGWNYWQNRTQQRNLAAAARYDQVIEAFGRNDVNGGFRLADELVKALAQGNADQALKTLDAVNPGAFAARYAEVRGDVLLAKGDRDGALKAYREARSSGGTTTDVGLLDLKIGELAHS